MATRVKEKAAARKANADKRPRATAKYIRVTPRKVKIVVDLIRGKQVDQALAILAYTPKSAAPYVEKPRTISKWIVPACTLRKRMQIRAPRSSVTGLVPTVVPT